MTGAGRHARTEAQPAITAPAGHYLRIKLFNDDGDSACQAAVLGQHLHEDAAIEAASSDVMKGAERVVIVKVVGQVMRSVQVTR